MCPHSPFPCSSSKARVPLQPPSYVLVEAARVCHTVWKAVTLGVASLSEVGITKRPESALLGNLKSFLPKLTHSISDEIIFLGQFNKILALSFPLIILF